MQEFDLNEYLRSTSEEAQKTLAKVSPPVATPLPTQETQQNTFSLDDYNAAPEGDEGTLRGMLIQSGDVDPATGYTTTGAKQWADTADSWQLWRANLGLGMMRSADEMSAGAKQGASVVTSALGGTPPDDWKKYKATTDQELETMVPDRLGAGNFAYSLGKLGTKLAPVFMLPAVAGQTVAGRLLYSTAINSVLGFAEYTDPNSPVGEKYRNALVNGAFGAVAQATPELWHIKKTMAKNKLLEIYDNPITKSSVARGEYLSAVSGVDMSPEKLSMNIAGDADRAFAGLAQQGMTTDFGSRRIINNHLEALKQGAQYISRVAKQTAPGTKIDPQKLADEIASNQAGTVSKMYNSAGEVFEGLFRKADTVAGGRPFIPADAIDDSIAKLAAKYGGQETADTMAAANVIQREGNRIAGMAKGGRLSPSQLMEEMKQLNAVLTGSPTKVLSGIPDQQMRRKVAGELKRSLMSGVDEVERTYTTPANITRETLQNFSSDFPGVSERVTAGFQYTDADKKATTMMRQAWKSYADNAQVIKMLSNTTVGKLERLAKLGSPAALEKYFGAISALPPSQLSTFVTALDSYAPELGATYRRYIIESALQKAVTNPTHAIETAAGKGVDFMDPEVVLKNLPKGDKFNIWFKGTHNEQQIREMVEVLNRLQLSPGMGTINAAEKLAKKVGTAVGAATVGKSSLLFGAKDYAKDFYPRLYATHMLSGDGRKALMALRNPSIRPEQVGAALGVLWAEQDAVMDILKAGKSELAKDLNTRTDRVSQTLRIPQGPQLPPGR